MARILCCVSWSIDQTILRDLEEAQLAGDIGSGWHQNNSPTPFRRHWAIRNCKKYLWERMLNPIACRILPILPRVFLMNPLVKNDSVSVLVTCKRVETTCSRRVYPTKTIRLIARRDRRRLVQENASFHNIYSKSLRRPVSKQTSPQLLHEWRCGCTLQERTQPQQHMHATASVSACLAHCVGTTVRFHTISPMHRRADTFCFPPCPSGLWRQQEDTT